MSVKGLDKAINGIDKTVAAVKAKVLKTLQLAAREAYIEAKTQVPVRSGLLRSSIRIESSTPFEYRVIAGGGRYKEKGKPYYAPFVEFGTRKMSPRPYMRPAFEKAKAFIEARL